MTSPVRNVVERAIVNLRHAWRSISQSVRLDGRSSFRLAAGGDDGELLRRQMQECLESRGGVVSARARAAGLGESYLDLGDSGRLRFLKVLAENFGVDHDAVGATATRMPDRAETDAFARWEVELGVVLAPRYLELLTRFNSLPSGVKFLVDMRADLRRLNQGDPQLNRLDNDLRDLLRSWFDIGFLEMKRITWDAPAALLERLIAYEAVHEIASWADLKSRLAQDRRCYAFFHPRMPEEPLIFVEVALVSKMSDSVQTVLGHSLAEDPTSSTTAIFYSISNTQPGLRGVNLGPFLIKRVADNLAEELPQIRTFATLSPIPNFVEYLQSRTTVSDLLSESETESLRSLAGVDSELTALKKLIATPGWHNDRLKSQALKNPLMRLCAEYLVRERVRGRARDRVANFHLSNGARIGRINWLADTSTKGMELSAGLMVNYIYERGDIEKNHEAYRTHGEATVSDEVRELLDTGEAPVSAAS